MKDYEAFAIKIKETYKHKTSDGELFDDERSAVYHEKFIYARSKLLESGIETPELAAWIADWMMYHLDFTFKEPPK